jgi:hypothetical protein
MEMISTSREGNSIRRWQVIEKLTKHTECHAEPERVILNLVQNPFRAGLFQHLINDALEWLAAVTSHIPDKGELPNKAFCPTNTVGVEFLCNSPLRGFQAEEFRRRERKKRFVYGSILYLGPRKN